MTATPHPAFGHLLPGGEKGKLSDIQPVCGAPFRSARAEVAAQLSSPLEQHKDNVDKV